MKKLFALLMVFVMVFTLAACDKGADTSATPNQSPSNASQSDPAKEEPKGESPSMIRIGTASMGGNFFTMGNSLAQLINDKVDGLKASSQATGGSGENCTLLNDGEIEIGLVQSSTLYDAATGTDTFDGRKLDSLRGLGVMYLNDFHILVRNDANIEKIEDIKGKRVGVGPMGGGIEINANSLLGAHGITSSDYSPIYGSLAENMESMKTGQVDAIIYGTAVGGANITDLLSTGDIKLLSISDEKIDELISVSTEFGKSTIPANTYVNQDYEIKTIAGSSVMVTADRYSEDLIYTLTKAIYENNDYLVNAHSYFAQAIPENAEIGMCIPFHPGAEKYLKEIGALQ